jgi:hypothetical protein
VCSPAGTGASIVSDPPFGAVYANHTDVVGAFMSRCEGSPASAVAPSLRPATATSAALGSTAAASKRSFSGGGLSSRRSST